MAFWLFKSEPATWSWAEQKAQGAKGAEWTGVRNYQARNFMREMKLGDLGFFYHSNEERAIVGVVKVIAPAHVDSTAEDPKWVCVNIAAMQDVAHPVSLEKIKQDERFQDMVLVKNSRLSVQPVTPKEWQLICAMGGVKN